WADLIENRLRHVESIAFVAAVAAPERRLAADLHAVVRRRASSGRVAGRMHAVDAVVVGASDQRIGRARFRRAAADFRCVARWRDRRPADESILSHGIVGTRRRFAVASFGDVAAARGRPADLVGCCDPVFGARVRLAVAAFGCIARRAGFAAYPGAFAVGRTFGRLRAAEFRRIADALRYAAERPRMAIDRAESAFAGAGLGYVAWPRLCAAERAFVGEGTVSAAARAAIALFSVLNDVVAAFFRDPDAHRRIAGARVAFLDDAVGIAAVAGDVVAVVALFAGVDVSVAARRGIGRVDAGGHDGGSNEECAGKRQCGHDLLPCIHAWTRASRSSRRLVACCRSCFAASQRETPLREHVRGNALPDRPALTDGIPQNGETPAMIRSKTDRSEDHRRSAATRCASPDLG